MNKVVRKRIAVGLVGLSLSCGIVPIANHSSVYADEINLNVTIKEYINDYVENYDYLYLSKLNKVEQEKYKKNLKLILSNSKYEHVNLDNVIESVDKYIAVENNFYIIEFRASIFDGQGITVDEMGAAIDTAISVALGGSVAFLANSVKRVGKHAVKSTLRQIISRFFGKWYVNDVFLEYLCNLVSPGAWLASEFDKIDRYPNNGRINLW